MPRRSSRIKSIKDRSNPNDDIPLSNRFVVTTPENTIRKHPEKVIKSPEQSRPKNKCKSDIILNISSTTLTMTEQNVLEKGFNLCPSIKLPDKMRVLDDLYRFCRKLKLKEYFFNPNKDDVPRDDISDEQCEINMSVSNRFYNPPQDPSDVLTTYISAVKKDVTETMNKPNYLKPNMTTEERDALGSLKNRKEIILQTADKGGKVVVMDRDEYIGKCKEDLSNKVFYEELVSDPTAEYVEKVKTAVNELKSQEVISEKDEKFLCEHLDEPVIPNFYGLPKIHKSFIKFPPLRPIVSNINSCTRRISEFLDSFLKFQAQRCSSFVRDTKHFLQKIEEVNNSKLPRQSVLVTMDVASLYTNIDHEEGAEACRIKLEQRKNKKISSETLKSLILLVLKCTAFKFGTKIYNQIKGTCMGTPMAPNYANLFMDQFENAVSEEYMNKAGLRPMVWYRYIDDIFFIWTDGVESLNDFIDFIQNYSDNNKMKSSMKFESNISSTEVNFLDVKVRFNNGILETDLYTKPTDAFLYLNSSSNHPKHVKSNIPKGQFIRIRRICSTKEDFFRNCRTLSSFFEKRGYQSKDLQRSVKEVANIPREKLLEDKIKVRKDPQMIFVCDWHPNMSQLPSIVRKHFHLLQNDHKSKDIFTSSPIVAYRRPKTIKNFVVRNNISNDDILEKPKTTEPCGKKCKLCKDILTTDTITNEKRGIKIKLNDGGTCQTKNVIYAAVCMRHNFICVGQTGEALCMRFCKHRYDIKGRPKNSEIAEHFHQNHEDGDMKVLILQSGLSGSKEKREYHEDRWMCLLQSLQAKNSSGMNKDINVFGKEMYECFSKLYTN